MLTFEQNKDDERIEIHADREGLLKLADILTALADENSADHVHLITEDWGGSGLTNKAQGERNTLAHHVKIFFWPKK